MRKIMCVVMCVVALAGGVEMLAAQRQDVKQILRRLEENTDRFSESLDSALDRSAINGTRAEDEINGYVHDFEEATDRLKDRYEDRGAAPGAAREVLVRAQSIDRFMRRNRLGGRAESDWRVVRSDLNVLARAYSIGWRW